VAVPAHPRARCLHRPAGDAACRGEEPRPWMTPPHPIATEAPSIAGRWASSHALDLHSESELADLARHIRPSHRNPKQPFGHATSGCVRAEKRASMSGSAKQVEVDNRGMAANGAPRMQRAHRADGIGPGRTADDDQAKTAQLQEPHAQHPCEPSLHRMQIARCVNGLSHARARPRSIMANDCAGQTIALQRPGVSASVSSPPLHLVARKVRFDTQYRTPERQDPAPPPGRSVRAHSSMKQRRTKLSCSLSNQFRVEIRNFAD
jgi:hypothetical protein